MTVARIAAAPTVAGSKRPGRRSRVLRRAYLAAIRSAGESPHPPSSDVPSTASGPSGSASTANRVRGVIGPDAKNRMGGWAVARFRTVTKPNDTATCRWCGRELAIVIGPGRPREYCRQSCRQRAYELRRRQLAGTLRSGEVPVSWSDFERVRDGLYALSTALDDVDGDLADDGDFEAAFRHLYQAASDLRGVELEVSAQG